MVMLILEQKRKGNKWYLEIAVMKGEYPSIFILVGIIRTLQQRIAAINTTNNISTATPGIPELLPFTSEEFDDEGEEAEFDDEGEEAEVVSGGGRRHSSARQLPAQFEMSAFPVRREVDGSLFAYVNCKFTNSPKVSFPFLGTGNLS